MPRNSPKLLLAVLGMLGILTLSGSIYLPVSAKIAAFQELPAATSVQYILPGIADDGLKGASGKIATTIICTNIGTVSTTLEMKLYQYNGVLIHTASLVAPPLYSFTFSTQPTAIYFDDVVFGSGGTVPINQGFAQVLSDNARIVCSAQILDPTGYPPTYIDKIPIHDRYGRQVGKFRSAYIPIVRKP